VSPVTNRFLTVTGSRTLSFGRRRYGRLFLAIAGLLVLKLPEYVVDRGHTGQKWRFSACLPELAAWTERRELSQFTGIITKKQYGIQLRKWSLLPTGATYNSYIILSKISDYMTIILALIYCTQRNAGNVRFTVTSLLSSRSTTHNNIASKKTQV